jgi:hypothetical protein
VADSPHWRNTWLLAAGKLVVSSDRFESVLLDLLRSLGQDARPVARVSPAPEIAADMLADALAQRRPGFERALAHTVLSARDDAPVRQLNEIASALNKLIEGGYRQIVLDHLSAASGFAQRATAAALLDVMQQLLDVNEAGRRQSIRLARRALRLSQAEDIALAAYMSFARPGPAAIEVSSKAATRRRTRIAPPGSGTLVGREESVTERLLAGLVELNLGNDVIARLAEGLAVLAPVRYRVTASEPALAALQSAPAGNPMTLLELLRDEDLATALELALGGLPAGYWALPAVVASTVHLGSSRRRVGRELEGLTAAPS